MMTTPPPDQPQDSGAPDLDLLLLAVGQILGELIETTEESVTPEAWAELWDRARAVHTAVLRQTRPQ